jgi:hypothetical protein
VTTETLDKLYLEWSQFTRARNAREIALIGLIEGVLEWPRPGQEDEDWDWDRARDVLRREVQRHI